MSQVPVLLITPPFTQLNTPYPATAYLKGFLSTRHIASAQADLGIEVTLSLFSQPILTRVFKEIPQQAWSENAQRMIQLSQVYLDTIDSVILFLQGKNPSLAHRIAQRNFLPEANRFAQTGDLIADFGSMGIQDKAKHLCTLYLEDLSDLIQECLDPNFGFSRYAERLARSANSFDNLQEALDAAPSLIDQLLFSCLHKRILETQPVLLAISVPFPGNLYAALRCGQYIHQHFPNIRVAMGGGFPNTELRSLTEPRVFDYVDYICLDDGEAPLENLILHLQGKQSREALKRTFIRNEQNQVVFIDNAACTDYRQAQVGTPDYRDLPLDQYLSAIEISNPMHSLWSDGRWNKLTMAHGCYWGKCSFCDITLPYIAEYEPMTAALIADRMQTLIEQTGTSGFHFVDEAAPPALMKALALEILARKMIVTWWANIRFEKAFTRDLCLLLKSSGCIAVSGGLEVASDRLLGLIRKGITVAQVALVNKHFSNAGIMVHAYLMYGFPSQTAQETIDSLEMVRQMFRAGILQSAFWHQFAMTAHAPVGLQPEAFGAINESIIPGSFANNDLVHRDPHGADHESFSFGLKKSLLNYMHGIGLDTPVPQWFEHKVPKTSISQDYITGQLESEEMRSDKPGSRVIFTGELPTIEIVTKTKKGNSWEIASLQFQTRMNSLNIRIPVEQGHWLYRLIQHLYTGKTMSLQSVKESYEQAGMEDFEIFWDNKPVDTLWKAGLLVV